MNWLIVLVGFFFRSALTKNTQQQSWAAGILFAAITVALAATLDSAQGFDFFTTFFVVVSVIGCAMLVRTGLGWRDLAKPAVLRQAAVYGGLVLAQISMFQFQGPEVGVLFMTGTSFIAAALFHKVRGNKSSIGWVSLGLACWGLFWLTSWSDASLIGVVIGLACLTIASTFAGGQRRLHHLGYSSPQQVALNFTLVGPLATGVCFGLAQAQGVAIHPDLLGVLGAVLLFGVEFFGAIAMLDYFGIGLGATSPAIALIIFGGGSAGFSGHLAWIPFFFAGILLMAFEQRKAAIAQFMAAEAEAARREREARIFVFRSVLFTFVFRSTKPKPPRKSPAGPLSRIGRVLNTRIDRDFIANVVAAAA